MMFGAQSSDSQQNMVCLVRVWRGAAVWTRPHSTKASVGPKKANPDGHPPTAFPRFCLQRAHPSKILQNLLIILGKHEQIETVFIRCPPDTVNRIGRFFVARPPAMYYSIDMLSGIRIFASDELWRSILADFNAVLVDDVSLADVDFDSLNISLPASPLEIKTEIINAADNSDILARLLGDDMNVSPIQARIIVRLYKTGGMTADELKVALGYAPDATTHTVNTAIYALRKKYGRDFIKNNDGKFSIGNI